MNGLLRIAWSYFWFVPLQRWINLAGLALVALGLVLFLLRGMDMTGLRNGSILAMIGCMFIALVPGYAGGAALRLASTRCQMHLRPHGRARMLLGATLAITMVAALVVAPLLLLGLASQAIAPAAAARSAMAGIGPLELLAFTWSCVALLWCGMFIATGSMLVFVVMVTTPALIKFAPVVFAYPAGTAILFVATLGAWLVFCAWYANVLALRTPVLSRTSRNDAPESSSTPAIGGPLGHLATRAAEFVDDLTGARDQAPTMARARRQLLIGTASPLGLFIAGSVPALFLLLIWFVVSRVGPPDPTWEIPMLWMMLASMMPATLGYSIARRARFLWLRAGVARAGLFNLAERSGLAAAVVLVLALTIGFLCISLSNRPDRAVVLLLYVAEQWVFAACVFYAGLAATRGWDAGGVLLAAFIGTLLLAHAIVIQPHHGTSAGLVAGALLLLLPVVGLLRWYARRRWLVLDWRIARLLNQPRH